MAKFYKKISDESCVGYIRPMFDKLGNKEKVFASLLYLQRDQGDQDDQGLSSSRMMAIHNHLDSSNMWKKTIPWVTEVEYTIPHPGGDITAFDTTSGDPAQLSRRSVVVSVTGGCAADESWRILLTRMSVEPFDRMDFNTSRFSWVKIMNTKRFYYETGTSSWVFKLVVSWEGLTKQAAKSGGKKYFVSVETNDNVKTSLNPGYSAASFLEKILDIISLDGPRQTLTF